MNKTTCKFCGYPALYEFVPYTNEFLKSNPIVHGFCRGAYESERERYMIRTRIVKRGE